MEHINHSVKIIKTRKSTGRNIRDKKVSCLIEDVYCEDCGINYSRLKK